MDRRYDVTREQIAQHLAGPHARELVGVPDQNQLARWTDRGHCCSGKLRVEHTGFVDNYHVEREWEMLSMAESIRARPKESMYGARLTPDDLAEPLGCLASGS